MTSNYPCCGKRNKYTLDELLDKCDTSEVVEDKPPRCPYNDCGWCYAQDDVESNDNNGQCNNPRSCKVLEAIYNHE